MNKPVNISRSEHKAAPELKRVFTQTVLAMPAGLGALARRGIVLSQKVKQGSVAESNRAVGLAFFVDQQGKRDFRVLTEMLGILDVAKPDRDETGAFLAKVLLVFAQLRDVLAAEDSAIVAKKYDHRRGLGPKRAEARGMAIHVGQSYSGQFAAEGFRHAAHSQVWRMRLSSSGSN
jgi:hypothetical protein